MRRKLVAVMLTAMVVSTSVVGCGENKTSETESKKVQTTTVKASTKKATSNHDAIKKYIEKADKIVIVKDAKNLDMEKAVSSMVSESQKDKVESVTVDDSKVDSTKAGTYPLTITVKLKEEVTEQKKETENTKTETEDKTETSKTNSKTESTVTDEVKTDKTETDASESKDKGATATDNKQESEKDTIKDTVDVIVADKDKADDLLDKGSAVVGDDSKVEVKDDKQVASNDTKKEETDKKTEEKKEDTTKKEETSKKDDAKKEETKKDTSSKSESSSSNKKQENTNTSSSTTKPSTSKPSTTTPTTNTNTNTGSTGNNQESSNTGNSSQTETKPAHQHNWVAQTHTVHHDATGHNEQYVVQDAWDETVTTYEDYAWDCCNVCGADCTADPGEHMYQHAIKYEGGGWHTEYGTRPVTSTVHHDAVYGTRWVQDSAAYDETVVDGYACSCGARK